MKSNTLENDGIKRWKFVYIVKSNSIQDLRSSSHRNAIRPKFFVYCKRIFKNQNPRNAGEKANGFQTRILSSAFSSNLLLFFSRHATNNNGQRGMKQGELTLKRTHWIKSNLFLFNFKFFSEATWHSFKLALCKCHIIRLLSPCRVAMLSTCHARMLAERTIILADKSIKIVTNLRII